MSNEAAVIECMLLRWSDSHTGRTVTLLLPDDGEHPFKGLPCGPANGQRLAVSVALIADDESQQPMEADKPRPSDETPNTGGAKSVAQRAGILCNDIMFRRFLSEEISPGCSSVGDAASAVRDWCGVTTRGAITADNPRWRDLMERFAGWQMAVNVVPA